MSKWAGSKSRRPGRGAASGVSLAERLRELEEQGLADACFIAVDELHYGQNLATLLRIGAAAGVHGIILPPSRSHPGLTPAVERMAGDVAREVPIVRQGLMAALTNLRRAGYLVIGAWEHGPLPFDGVDYTGRVAFVLGGEDKGLTPAVQKKCDALVSLPMQGPVPSLNVAATASVLVLERLRQLQRAGRGARR